MGVAKPSNVDVVVVKAENSRVSCRALPFTA